MIIKEMNERRTNKKEAQAAKEKRLLLRPDGCKPAERLEIPKPNSSKRLLVTQTVTENESDMKGGTWESGFDQRSKRQDGNRSILSFGPRFFCDFPFNFVKFKVTI